MSPPETVTLLGALLGFLGLGAFAAARGTKPILPADTLTLEIGSQATRLKVHLVGATRAWQSTLPGGAAAFVQQCVSATQREWARKQRSMPLMLEMHVLLLDAKAWPDWSGRFGGVGSERAFLGAVPQMIGGGGRAIVVRAEPAQGRLLEPDDLRALICHETLHAVSFDRLHTMQGLWYENEAADGGAPSLETRAIERAKAGT